MVEAHSASKSVFRTQEAWGTHAMSRAFPLLSQKAMPKTASVSGNHKRKEEGIAET